MVMVSEVISMKKRLILPVSAKGYRDEALTVILPLGMGLSTEGDMIFFTKSRARDLRIVPSWIKIFVQS